MTKQIELREEWLQQAVKLLTPLFDKAGYTLPPVRVTCGWPITGGRPGKRTRLGECWHASASEDGLPQIFITPLYADPALVLPVLVHELAHAVAGEDAGHKGLFVTVVRAVGLEGKPTATHAGEELTERLHKQVIDKLSPYPHAAIKLQPKQKVQSTRMLKAKCPKCECTFRITHKWVEEAGDTLHCPMPECGEEVEMEQKDDE